MPKKKSNIPLHLKLKERAQRFQRTYAEGTMKVTVSPGELRTVCERVEELETAIRMHRRDIWGGATPGHPQDVELYQLIEREDNEAARQ